MPSYTSSRSNAIAYEVVFDPDLVPGLNTLQRELGSHIASANPALVVASRYYQRDPSRRIDIFAGSIGLRTRLGAQLQGVSIRVESLEVRVRFELLQLRAIDREIRSLQALLTASRGFSSGSGGIISLFITINAADDLRQARARRRRQIQVVRRIAANLQSTLRSAESTAETALEEVESINAGSQSYFTSILLGLAEGIYVQFRRGEIYRWQQSRVGQRAIEQMVALGEENRGLVSFIQERVKYSYS